MSDNNEIESAFKTMDTDNSGYIDKKELAECLKKCGLDVTKEVCDEIYDAMDEDKDGKVSLDEFKKIAQQC